MLIDVGVVADAAIDGWPAKWIVGTPRLSARFTDSVPPMLGNALMEFSAKVKDTVPDDVPPGATVPAGPTVTAANTPDTAKSDPTVATSVAARAALANLLGLFTKANLLDGR
jgi:hypothetical protein